MDGYILLLSATGADLTVWCGDYRIYVDEGPEHQTNQLLNPWITQPEQALCLEFSCQEPADWGMVTLKMQIEFREGEVIEPLHSMDSSIKALAASQKVIVKELNELRCVLEFPIAADPRFQVEPPWFADSNGGESAVFDAFMNLYRPFIAREVDTLKTLATEKISFTAAVTHQDAGDLRQRVNSMLENLMSKESLWSQLRYPEMQLQIFWIKKNEVCRVYDLTNEPPLRTEPVGDEDFFEGIDVVMAHTRAGWIWVF